MLLKHLQTMAAGCLALSIATIASLSSLSNVRAESTLLWEGDRSKPTANNINQVVAQRNFNSESRAKREIENNRWNQFTAPDKGIPGRREGGGTRGPSLTALVPQTLMGLTLSGRPTFYYYVSSPLKNSTVEFELADEDDNTIYKTSFNMNTPEAGIFSISIPESETSPVLEVGKTYRLYLTASNADGSFLDLVTGWVKRVELSPSLMTKLEGANLGERLGIYEGEAIWYDALAVLGDLRQSNPGDVELELKWNQLLKEVKLDPLAQQPFLQTQLVSE
jgi:hypothetical protein